jgi:hypothetical protein
MLCWSQTGRKSLEVKVSRRTESVLHYIADRISDENLPSGVYGVPVAYRQWRLPY